MADSGLFGRTTGGLVSSPRRRRTKPLGAKDVTDILKSNTKTRERVEKLGVKFENEKDKPNFLEKVLGILNAGSAAGVATLNNVLTDKDVNIGGEFVKSLKGEKTLSGGDLLGNMGVNPKSTFGKFVKGAAGLAIDIGADPATYLSFGFSAPTKLKAASEAVKLFDVALDAERAASLAKYIPEVGEYAGKVVGSLGNREQMKVWKAVLAETGEALGDKGGIKLALGYTRKAGKKVHVTPSLVTGSQVSEILDKIKPKAVTESALADGVKDVAGKAASLFTPDIRDANELGKIGQLAKKAAHNTRVKGGRAAIAEGVEVAERVFGKGKDAVAEDVRNAIPIALQRQDINAAAKGDAYKRMKAAKEAFEDAVKGMKSAGVSDEVDFIRDRAKAAQEAYRSAQAELTQLVDADAIDWDVYLDELTKLTGRTLSEDELIRVKKATEAFTDELRRVRLDEVNSGMKVGDRGMFYVPGMDGKPSENVVGKLVDELDPADEDAAAIIDQLKNMRSAEGGGRGRGSRVDPTQSKDFGTIEERLKAGVGATTDAREILARRVAEVKAAKADRQFLDEVATKFGEPVSKGDPIRHFEGDHIKHSDGTQYRLPRVVMDEVNKISGFYKSPESVRIFRENVGKLTSIWKSQATATPGFFIRNAQSNFFLASVHGMGDLDSWATATKIALGKLDDAAEITLGGQRFTVGELRELIREQGVKGGQMSDIIEDPSNMGKLRYTLSGHKIAEGVHKANSVVEDTGRIAVFMQSLDRGMGVDEAGDMVNRVLYSYDKNDLTSFEQGLKDVIPFYTWLRRNLPAQVSNLIHDPKTISVFGKLQNEGDSVTGRSTKWGDMPDYMREMGAIPFPLPGGKKAYLNPNWGWQDIQKLEALTATAKGDFKPLLDEFLGNLSPFIKVPAELAFNRDSFFETDIVPHKGHLVKAPQWTQNLEGYFKGQAWWEQMKKSGGSYTKRDGTLMVSPVTTKMLSSIPLLANIGRLGEPGEKQAGRWMSIMAGLKVMPDESEKWAEDRAYDEQAQLRDLINALKDRGVDTKAPKKPKKKKPLVLGGKE